MTAETEGKTDSAAGINVPAEEIQNRQLAVQSYLQQNGIDGLFVVQRVDLFYLSGTAQNGFLYLPAEGKPLLFIKKYLPRAKAESPIEQIVQIKSIKEIPDLIRDAYGRMPDVLGFELDVLPVNDFNFYNGLLKPKKYVDASPYILKARQTKSEWEVAQLDRVAESTRSIFEYMQTIICPGMSEIEFAGMFQTYAGRLGHVSKLRVRDHLTEGYPGHVLSGKSGGMVGLLDSPASGEGPSPAFPAGAGHKLICADEPIMVDMATSLNGWHTDETRMFAIGSMPKKAFDASRAAIEIHNEVIEEVRPGITLGELFDCSVAYARANGFGDVYLGPKGHQVSFVGHGVGLELIEPPIIAKNKHDQLEPGMTFALEPKLVYDGEFIAGVESVILVTDTGSRLISQVPVEIFVV